MEEINELKREGLSIQAISQLTGFDRKTIRKYLLKPTGRPMYSARHAPVSKLESFKPYLKERLQVGVWNARVLLRELRQRNYQGSYTILTDWLRPQRESARVVAVRRFETPPGKQAQVDWGHLGSLTGNGGARMLWGFTMTLGYSRIMMAAAATDQKLGTLLRMHEAAFEQWGGVPEEILYDRMKTVWTGTDERGEIVWNAVFLDFARYWGFTPRLCRPYRAQTTPKWLVMKPAPRTRKAIANAATRLGPEMDGFPQWRHNRKDLRFAGEEVNPINAPLFRPLVGEAARSG